MKVLLVLFAVAASYASSVINLSIQPMKASTKDSYLRKQGYENRYQWVFNGEYGWRLGEHVALGPSVGFSLNIEKNKENNDLVYSKERIAMLPVSAFFLVDPFPRFMIHPIIHGSVGYNSVFISNVDYKKDSPEASADVTRRDGYYNGFILKFGADCMVDIGQTISIFAGPQWQFSEVERKNNNHRTGGLRPVEKFNAFGFRFGVSILL